MTDLDRPRILIESIGTYLPSNVTTAAEIVNGCTKPLIFPFEALTGIHSVRTARDEFGIDLARKAIADCLARSSRDPREIGLLICTSISKSDSPDCAQWLEPSTAVRLRDEFGFENALAFDLMNACPGMFNAIKVIESFIATGAIECGMVVSGEYISHLARTAQKEIDGFTDPRLACLTLGDAGAAAIIEAATDDHSGFHDLELVTLGEYSTLCIAKLALGPHGGAIMHTDPARLNPPALSHSAALASRIVAENEWGADYIQHVIPHQTSTKTLSDAGKEIDSAMGRKGWAKLVTMNNLGERGNTATTSHFVALMDGFRSGRIRSGDNVLFIPSGSGLTVGAALYTFDDLPDRMRGPAQIEGRAGSPRPRQASAAPSPRLSDGWSSRIEAVATVPAAWEGPRETVPLAVAAAKLCLERAKVDPASVRLLLYCGIYRTDGIVEPAIAALIAGELQLNLPAQLASRARNLAFDVVDSSLGLLTACHLAAHFLQAEGGGRALIVTSEVDVNRRTAGARARGIADTGAAMLLHSTPTTRSRGETGFEDVLFETRAEHRAAFEAYLTSEATTEAFVRMRGSSLAAYYLEQIPSTVSEFLERHQLSRDDIAWVLAPQLSSEFITELSARLKISRGRFVDVALPDRDLYTSALPRALEVLLGNSDAKPGQLCLFVSAGAGIRVGCMTYRLTEQPSCLTQHLSQ